MRRFIIYFSLVIMPCSLRAEQMKVERDWEASGLVKIFDFPSVNASLAYFNKICLDWKESGDLVTFDLPSIGASIKAPKEWTHRPEGGYYRDRRGGCESIFPQIEPYFMATGDGPGDIYWIHYGRAFATPTSSPYQALQRDLELTNEFRKKADFPLYRLSSATPIVTSSGLNGYRFTLVGRDQNQMDTWSFSFDRYMFKEDDKSFFWIDVVFSGDTAFKKRCEDLIITTLAISQKSKPNSGLSDAPTDKK